MSPMPHDALNDPDGLKRRASRRGRIGLQPTDPGPGCVGGLGIVPFAMLPDRVAPAVLRTRQPMQ
jgi:hypothetical protein